jgi:hypothetical protein
MDRNLKKALGILSPAPHKKANNDKFFTELNHVILDLTSFWNDRMLEQDIV